MMNTLKKFFFYLAITGWLLSLIVHLFSIFHFHFNFEEEFPYVFFLHIGIFIVGLPALIFAIKRIKQEKIELGIFSFFSFFKIIFGGIPMFMTIIFAATFIYATINDFSFSQSYEGMPDIENEKYILQNFLVVGLYFMDFLRYYFFHIGKKKVVCI